MPVFTQELHSVNDQEREFAQFLTEVSKIETDDCRRLREVIKNHIADKQLRFVIGCGGSHIWIHRESQHVAGNPILSQRWAIITD